MIVFGLILFPRPLPLQCNRVVLSLALLFSDGRIQLTLILDEVEPKNPLRSSHETLNYDIKINSTKPSVNNDPY